MTEQYLSNSELAALSGASDSRQEVLFVPTGESPYYVSFYKMLYRLLDVSARAGDLRVYKDAAAPLTFGVRAGKFFNGDAVVSYAGAAEQELSDSAVNYIYLTADGELTVNQTGFPPRSLAPHIRLATIVAAGGDFALDDITDFRGTALLSPAASLPLAGDSYILVARGATDAASGVNLLAAYAAAKALTPGGNALSSTNRAVVLIPPGRYDLAPLTGAAALTLNGEYVDLVAMASDNPAATWITSAGGDEKGSTVKQTAADVRLTGFTIRNAGSGAGNHSFEIDASNAASVYRCVHFRSVQQTSVCCPVKGTSDINGTWEFCIGDNFSWRPATDKALSATMRDCQAGTYSFGSDSTGVTITGRFERCVAGNSGFGGCDYYGCNVTAAAVFEDCRAGDKSFAMGKDFAGTARRCVGGSACFGGYAGSETNYGSIAAGAVLEDCQATGLSFGSHGYGPSFTVIGATNAASAVLTLDTTYQIPVGGRVVLTGMVGTGGGTAWSTANGNYRVTAVAGATITIGLDTSAYQTYTASSGQCKSHHYQLTNGRLVRCQCTAMPAALHLGETAEILGGLYVATGAGVQAFMFTEGVVAAFGLIFQAVCQSGDVNSYAVDGINGTPKPHGLVVAAPLFGKFEWSDTDHYQQPGTYAACLAGGRFLAF